MTAPNISLKSLLVIDKLEIGPLKIEPNRLIAPYKIVQNKVENSIDLICHFEESVFEPDDLVSHNLACMISAQVALNYGLFCNKLVFRGMYDATDQKFIRQMAQNTAREIYVNKFLQPNTFLRGKVATLPVVKLDDYLQSELIFVDTPSNNKINSDKWENDNNRFAILSSGGKDSLLSYGLLSEIGMETHPIFVNESGRHWYTALNAYRYFRENIPHTVRVWTNADRVFTWMLRHFPFIRKDFANVRADYYPIRLWTVAVFLFGVLPILRKRQIGRLVIGDEYDTTRRTKYKDIPHYDGLYDQSRYFDDALTRYFQQKKWRIEQFSILRPLSELLIETILIKRYPHLQKHQVSCHAAHIVGDRVFPCGRCEKCRRIVAMLKAVDADPAICGYTSEQITTCLKAIVDKSIHTESEGAKHLLYLLQSKGLINLPESKKISAIAHPEIMKIRIHPEKSPWEVIPDKLRSPLFNIFKEHTEGIVKREGKEWIDIEI